VQGDEFHGRVSHHFMEFNWKGWTVEFLQGDFMKIGGLLDRMELQECCSASTDKGSKLRRASAIDRDHEDH
jgi:hypothetical protein